MRYLLLSLALLSSVVTAGELRMGVNGGYSHANDMQEENLYSGQIYGQYVFDQGIGIEGGYNYFGNGTVNVNGTELDAVAHGPYAAVSLNAGLGQNLDFYARTGAMYSIFHAEGPADSGKRVSPFVGIGAQFSVTDHFYGRVGYDHYFKATNTDESESDIDMMYLGLGFNI